MSHRTRITVAILGVATLLMAWLVSPARAVDYGSGQLGDWPSWGHAQIDPWASADVGIVGDSITGRCYPRLNTRLTTTGRTLAVNYWSGRPLAPAVDWVLARVAAGQPLPPVLIMASGTNDIYNPPVVQAQVARLKAGLPSTTELLFVDVTASRWGRSYSTATQVSDMRNSSWVNGQIRAVLPDPQVIGWAAQMATLPGRGVALTYYSQDGVHPWPSAIDGHGDGCDLWAFTLMGKALPAAKKAGR